MACRNHPDIGSFGDTLSEESSKGVAIAVDMDISPVAGYFAEFGSEDESGSRVEETPEGSMNQRNLLGTEVIVDNLGIACKGKDVPSLTMEMAADIKSVLLGSTPMVGGNKMNESRLVRHQLREGRISLKWRA